MTSDLITRLSKLDAPDREVDAQIEVAVRRIEAARSGLAEEYWANWQASLDGTVYDPHTRYPSNHFTASVDAAIALAERVLPFTHLVSTYHDDMASSVKIHCCPEGLSGEWKFDVKGDHERLAIAYCIAILRAIALLRAKEASKP
ncbi:hypothetical protein FHW02_004303 [Ochrobactrum sp. RH1CCR137]|nr:MULTISPECIES: hypothetical protein [unclassified Ochrobactrum]MBA8846213.1 hypothetical protein [Ochrobactrum sp. RH1CCR137]MBA8858032.1 hypothetical protein [Ochrobactrum sp. RH1CCR134]